MVNWGTGVLGLRPRAQEALLFLMCVRLRRFDIPLRGRANAPKLPFERRNIIKVSRPTRHFYAEDENIQAVAAKVGR